MASRVVKNESENAVKKSGSSPTRDEAGSSRSTSPRPGSTASLVTKSKSVAQNSTKGAIKKAVRATGISNVTNRLPETSKSSATSHAIVPRPSKWDYKGRLELVNKQLAKEKSECHDLSAILKEKLEELEEAKKSSMKNRYDKAKADRDELLKKSNEMIQKLKKAEEKSEELLKIREMKKEVVENEKNKLEDAKQQIMDQKSFMENAVIKEKILQGKIQEADGALSKISEQQSAWKFCAHEMRKEIDDLQDTVHSLRGHTRVFCRVNPKKEEDAAENSCFIQGVDECMLSISRLGGSRKDFNFDQVFLSSSSQADISEELFFDAQLAARGISTFIFLCGSNVEMHTLEGDLKSNEKKGIFYGVAELIFNKVRSSKLLGWTYEVKARFVEVREAASLELASGSVKNLNDLIEMLEKANKSQQSTESNLVIQIELNRSDNLKGFINFVMVYSMSDPQEKVILGLIQKKERDFSQESAMFNLLMPQLSEKSNITFLINVSALSKNYIESLKWMKFGSFIYNALRVKHEKV